MDKQVTLNKIEQLITTLNKVYAAEPSLSVRQELDPAIALAIQIRQQIRKA